MSNKLSWQEAEWEKYGKTEDCHKGGTGWVKIRKFPRG